MIYENTLVLYAPDQGEEFMRKEKEDKQRTTDLLTKLKSLREFNPEAYEELEDAMKFMRGEKHLYSINLFAEYGLLDNPGIQALLEKQERILAIARSNKDIETLQAALDEMNYVTTNSQIVDV